MLTRERVIQILCLFNLAMFVSAPPESTWILATGTLALAATFVFAAAARD